MHWFVIIKCCWWVRASEGKCPIILQSVLEICQPETEPGIGNFNNNNNNNNNQWQCLWCCLHDHGHCESSPGSFDECRLSAGWPPTLRPSQPTWAVSPPINGCYHPHPPSPFVIITQPESWYSFYRPQRVEGCVDLGTAGRVRSPCPRLYIAVAVVINITGRGLSPQSIMPSLCHFNLLRHVGVNNLPKVVTQQRRSRD